MRQPLVVLVSGAPGSGKTTLAHNLAQYLRIPHVPRDEVLRGLEMTKGDHIDRGSEGVAAYYELIAYMCESGISLVTDGTLYAGISEDDIKSKLLPAATVINVHARAQNEQERFVQRETQRQGWSSDWVRSHMTHLDKIYEQTVHPLNLGVAIIEVDATDGYTPSIGRIAAQIREAYSDTRAGYI